MTIIDLRKYLKGDLGKAIICFFSVIIFFGNLIGLAECRRNAILQSKEEHRIYIEKATKICFPYDFVRSLNSLEIVCKTEDVNKVEIKEIK